MEEQHEVIGVVAGHKLVSSGVNMRKRIYSFFFFFFQMSIDNLKWFDCICAMCTDA